MVALKIQKNVSLASLSTFRIGGRVREFVEVCSAEELIEAIRLVNQRKPFDFASADAKALADKQGKNPLWRIFAGGSNVVFPDKGMDCLLIRMKGGLVEADERRLIRGYTQITADVGVPLAEVIAFAVSKGLQGLETLSGIPGTIGGAVYGNAGAYGHSIAEAVEKVEVLLPRAEQTRNKTQNRRGINPFIRKWISNTRCKFEYRESIFKKKDWIILRVALKLNKGDGKALELKSQEIIALREKKYKPGIRCPGSFFKNVLVKDVSKKSLALVDPLKIIDGKIPAGWLLEQVGAKGMREGGIYIADFHGNLFVNDGQGRAEDVKALARKLKKKVFDKFGIVLEEEVRYF